jgi:prepilin-type N-terminal cleavage/methylation domain-containing protein
MQQAGKGQGGFTLIEVLIVIFIIGIITAIVVLNAGGFLGTGTKEAAMTEKDTVQTAVLSAMGSAGVDHVTETAGLTGDPTVFDALINEVGNTYISSKLMGTVQGLYDVGATGVITRVEYPATGTEWWWTPGSGWVDTEPEP